MVNKDYNHYKLLSKEELISIIIKKDNELTIIQSNCKSIQKLKDKYYLYNKFHMEEIARLDKVIGNMKGLR